MSEISKKFTKNYPKTLPGKFPNDLLMKFLNRLQKKYPKKSEKVYKEIAQETKRIIGDLSLEFRKNWHRIFERDFWKKNLNKLFKKLPIFLKEMPEEWHKKIGKKVQNQFPERLPKNSNAKELPDTFERNSREFPKQAIIKKNSSGNFFGNSFGNSEIYYFWFFLFPHKCEKQLCDVGTSSKYFFKNPCKQKKYFVHSNQNLSRACLRNLLNDYLTNSSWNYSTGP